MGVPPMMQLMTAVHVWVETPAVLQQTHVPLVRAIVTVMLIARVKQNAIMIWITVVGAVLMALMIVVHVWVEIPAVLQQIHVRWDKETVILMQTVQEVQHAVQITVEAVLSIAPMTVVNNLGAAENNLHHYR